MHHYFVCLPRDTKRIRFSSASPLQNPTEQHRSFKLPALVLGATASTESLEEHIDPRQTRPKSIEHYQDEHSQRTYSQLALMVNKSSLFHCEWFSSFRARPCIQQRFQPRSAAPHGEESSLFPLREVLLILFQLQPQQHNKRIPTPTSRQLQTNPKHTRSSLSRPSHPSPCDPNLRISSNRTAHN